MRKARRKGDGSVGDASLMRLRNRPGEASVRRWRPSRPWPTRVRSCAAMGPVLILWEGASRPIKAELQRVGAEMAGLRADRDDHGAFASRMDLGEKERPALTLVVGPEGGFAEKGAGNGAIGRQVGVIGSADLKDGDGGPGRCRDGAVRAGVGCARRRRRPGKPPADTEPSLAMLVLQLRIHRKRHWRQTQL